MGLGKCFSGLGGLLFLAIQLPRFRRMVFAALLLFIPPSLLSASDKVGLRDALIYTWIPSGSYFTGCLSADRECYGLERLPEKIVMARGFWIGRTEVTQAAYKQVMNADPSYYKGLRSPG